MSVTRPPSAAGNEAPAASPGGYRLVGVSRVYRSRGKEVRALSAVDLDIAPGEFLAVRGPTGGGKSTLLQLLGALDRPTEGRVELSGRDLAAAPPGVLTRVRAREIGFVFQGFNLLPTLTAAENVDMGLEPLGLSSAERRTRVGQALEHVGLTERADHRPGELSGGQQQRVAIARAIVKSPRVLLADEPTGNLDEQTRDEIMDLLQGLQRDGLTLVVVTHDSAVARRADRQLRLAGGRIAQPAARA